MAVRQRQGAHRRGQTVMVDATGERIIASRASAGTTHYRLGAPKISSKNMRIACQERLSARSL